MFQSCQGLNEIVDGIKILSSVDEDVAREALLGVNLLPIKHLIQREAHLSTIADLLSSINAVDGRLRKRLVSALKVSHVVRIIREKGYMGRPSRSQTSAGLRPNC